MNVKEFKNLLIPAIKTFCKVPIIEADQRGDKPDGSHATFKITTPYMKGVGQANEIYEQGQDKLIMRRVDEFKRVLSFTAYDMDDDVSFELAQQIHDWFEFYGMDFLDSKNIVVVEKTAVQNRDIFLFDDYERRNGFDVILRLTRELSQEIDYIEKTDMFDNLEVTFEDPVELITDYQAAKQPLLMATTSTKVGQESIL